MIDWSKVEWGDVAMHAADALVIASFLAWFGAPWIVAAGVNVVFWYVREALQHTERGPWVWQWGWGSQVEFYVPAIVGMVVAAILCIAAR